MSAIRKQATDADRYTVSIETDRPDGEDRTLIHLRDAQIPWVQVDCRIQTPANILHAAFSIDALEVALAEDIAPQEAAVAAMEDVLARHFGANADPLRTMLHHAWDRTQDRLEARWRDTAKEAVQPDRLCIQRYAGEASGAPALAGWITTLGRKGRFGVYLPEGAKEYETLSDAHDVLPPTRELIGNLKNLSGHRKLELMGANGAEYARARAAFDRWRVRCLAWRDRVRALPEGDALGIGAEDGQGGTILYADGDWGTIALIDAQEFFQFERTFARDRYDIEVGRARDGTLRIVRRRGKDERFKSPDLLDSALRRLIGMLLAWDEPMPDWCVPERAAPFDPDHPVIAGMDVPPRHHAFVGALLGAPYAKARKRAEARAAKLARESTKVEAVSALPDQLADGALVGIHGQNVNRYGGLHMVVTDSSSGARRRRCAVNVATPRYERFPLTPRHLAHLPKVDDPDALRFLSDRNLRGDERDVIEGAYRLSFALEPKARNPLLETQARIDVVEDLPTGYALRITDHPGADGCALLALAVVSQYPLSYTFTTPFEERRFGAAYMILTVSGQRHFHLRPMNVHGTISLPPDNRATIEAGIDRLRDTGRIEAEDAAAMRDGLATEWAALSDGNAAP